MIFSPSLLWSNPSQNNQISSKALLSLLSQSVVSASIPLFSRVDHRGLISICFALISHNSSIAAAVPADRACPYASRRRPAALLHDTCCGLVGFSIDSVQALSSASTRASWPLCCVLCPFPMAESLPYIFFSFSRDPISQFFPIFAFIG